MDNRSVEQCQEIIGYTFKNPDLLALSLTHSSSASDRLESNERLEFLGDAVPGHGRLWTNCTRAAPTCPKAR